MSKDQSVVRVVVIDDSIFMRQMISDLLNEDSNIEVVAVAKDGEDGVDKIKTFKPDVVTLDYEMPGTDGITALKEIMRDCPTPVVMISGYTKQGADVTLTALSHGAVDYILKPSGTLSLDIKTIKEEIIKKIKLASKANMRAVEANRVSARKLIKEEHLHLHAKHAKAVAIGSSTGGTSGVELILSALPADFPVPVFVVQHMPEMFTRLFADRLNKIVKIKVKEAENGDVIESGTVYVAPGDWHMKVEIKNNDHVMQDMPEANELRIKLTKDNPVFGLRPSVDVLMQSVADIYESKCVGIILSGMGSDGTDGMGAIFNAGGITIAQDEHTSMVFGMPRKAIESGSVEDVLSISAISQHIVSLFSDVI